MTISFNLSDELRSYRDELRQWSLHNVRPLARQADTDHAVPANWRTLIETCPVSLGPGDPRPDMPKPTFAEGHWVQRLVTIEALCYGDHWIIHPMGQGIGHLVVEAMGTPAQIERWYTPIMNGSGSTAFALTEPQFGSDTSMVATTATRDGDTWVLNGSKMYCSLGATADYVVVFATTDASLGPSAIKAFVVEAATPGMVIAKPNEDKLGIRCWVTSELVFDGCAIPLDHQLGHDASASPDPATTGATRSGRSGALSALSQNKANMTAIGVALAQASVDLTTERLTAERGEFTDRRWAVVEAELEQMNQALERARRINIRAQWLHDSGANSKLESSVAKGYGPPTIERIIRRCIQLIGPDATSQDLLLEKWYRDVKILDIFEGSGQVQRVILGRAIFGSSAVGS
jgi:acyl-CoA dehydrogenase